MITSADHLNRAFKWGIALNIIYTVVEATIGILSGSMGLIADAGHNLSDVVSLVLALLAFRLSKLRPNSHYTYGYRKATILISLLNAVILLVAVGVIVAESIGKLFSPHAVEGGAIVWTAGIGVVVNALTAWLFIGDKDRDLNVKGAYLHMLADAMVSIGVVVSGIVIGLTGWMPLDPIIGLVVAVVIVVSTWRLLVESLRMSMDGVPEGIDKDEIERDIAAVEGVSNVHHVHIWALSTTETALTAHVVVRNAAEAESVREKIESMLAEHGIGHVTIQTELQHTQRCDCCGTDNTFA